MTDEERELLARLRAGETVVLDTSYRGHKGRHQRLWEWARQAGLAVRITRYGGVWGNPYVIGRDGDREECCDRYETVHWPSRPDLQAMVHELRGKALGCHCGTQRCHGLFLKQKAEE
jgi:hypothetical protein